MTTAAAHALGVSRLALMAVMEAVKRRAGVGRGRREQQGWQELLQQQQQVGSSPACHAHCCDRLTAGTRHCSQEP
jgi:hypothetical protein